MNVKWNWTRCLNIKNLEAVNTDNRCRMSLNSYSAAEVWSSLFAIRHPLNSRSGNETKCRWDIKSRKSNRGKTRREEFHCWFLGKQIYKWWPRSYTEMLVKRLLTNNNINDQLGQIQMSILVNFFDVSLQHKLNVEFVWNGNRCFRSKNGEM